MPAALETSKRKFHKLLDSLTGTSAGDRPGTPEDGNGASKRQRLTPRSRLAASHPLVNSSTNLRSIYRIPSSNLSAQKVADVRVPNFAPWSRENFQTRLKTFSNVTWWGSKSPSINEVAWSKRGWICEGKNRVACKGGCEERIVVSLRPKAKGLDGKEIEGSEDFNVDVSEDLVKRYEQLIIDGHKEDCLWRGSGCADDIMRMPLARPTIWQPGLRERYASFYALKDSLPPANVIRPPLDLDATSNQLGEDFFQTSLQSSETRPMDKVALSFALLGWYGHSEPGRTTYASATCPDCFRRIGLWLYTNRPSTSSSTYSKRPSSTATFDSIREPSRTFSSEREEIDEDQKLDIAENHKEYCPWINAESQATPGPLAGMSGCEILKKVISNWAALRARANRAQDRQPLTTRPSTPVDGLGHSADGDRTIEEPAEAGMSELTASREETRRQDNARFARLRELSRIIGLKSFKIKTGKENQTAGL